MNRFLWPLLLFLAAPSWCYTVVQASTSAPAGLEKQFIASTTNQYQSVLYINPLSPNTYQLTLQGLNPAYNAPLTSLQLLNQINTDAAYMATVDSYTYVNGWADGESYNQYATNGIVDNYLINCSTPTDFYLIQTTTATFDSKTCYDVLATMTNAIMQLQLSTPTVVPGQWQ